MNGCREGEVRDCCLKNYGVLYFSNVWWDNIIFQILIARA